MRVTIISHFLPACEMSSEKQVLNFSKIQFIKLCFMC